MRKALLISFLAGLICWVLINVATAFEGSMCRSLDGSPSDPRSLVEYMLEEHGEVLVLGMVVSGDKERTKILAKFIFANPETKHGTIWNYAGGDACTQTPYGIDGVTTTDDAYKFLMRSEGQEEQPKDAL